jgi:hypothetical protein
MEISAQISEKLQLLDFSTQELILNMIDKFLSFTDFDNDVLSADDLADLELAEAQYERGEVYKMSDVLWK